MLDAGIEKFFDTLDQQRLMHFIEHQVGDKRIHRPDPQMTKDGHSKRLTRDG